MNIYFLNRTKGGTGGKNQVKIEIDEYEKDLLIDTIQHRLETDKLLVINDSLRDDLKDLLMKIEDDEYL